MAEEFRRGHSIRIESVQSLFENESLSGLREKLSQSDLSSPHLESLSVTGESEDQVLIVDGEIIPYLRTAEGFRVYYQPAAASLLEAARSYVDTQPEASQ